MDFFYKMNSPYAIESMTQILQHSPIRRDRFFVSDTEINLNNSDVLLRQLFPDSLLVISGGSN